MNEPESCFCAVDSRNIDLLLINYYNYNKFLERHIEKLEDREYTFLVNSNSNAPIQTTIILLILYFFPLIIVILILVYRNAKNKCLILNPRSKLLEKPTAKIASV